MRSENAVRPDAPLTVERRLPSTEKTTFVILRPRTLTLNGLLTHRAGPLRRAVPDWAVAPRTPDPGPAAGPGATVAGAGTAAVAGAETGRSQAARPRGSRAARAG